MEHTAGTRTRPRVAHHNVAVCYRCGGEFPRYSRVPASHVAACRRVNPQYVYVCPIEPCGHAPFATWRRAALHIRRDHAGDWQAREPSVGIARILRIKKSDYEQHGTAGGTHKPTGSIPAGCAG